MLARIPEESLANQETFFAWLVRMVKTAARVLQPRRVRMFFLLQAARALNAVRVFFLKVYHAVEAMAKTTREKSQKMDWEHRWFSPKEVEGNGKEQVDEEKRS